VGTWCAMTPVSVAAPAAGVKDIHRCLSSFRQRPVPRGREVASRSGSQIVESRHLRSGGRKGKPSLVHPEQPSRLRRRIPEARHRRVQAPGPDGHMRVRLAWQHRHQRVATVRVERPRG
jgi:hypothetical protein